jgi:hypothetical protein
MALTWKKPWNRGGDAPRVDCECVCLLTIPRYIFIVRRPSILSKLDFNNPYRIWVELYFLNLNYLIILGTWPIWPYRRPRRSRFTSWSYLSFGPILFTAHLLVWSSYGDNIYLIIRITKHVRTAAFKLLIMLDMLELLDFTWLLELLNMLELLFLNC